MIKNDFKIDFENKTISFIGKNDSSYSVSELYSFLQDTFDNPGNMKYDIPIIAKSKNTFELANGWTIDKASLEHIQGNLS